MADSSRMRQPRHADAQHHQTVRSNEQKSAQTLAADDNPLDTLRRIATGSLDGSPANMLALQRTIGNRAVGRVLAGRARSGSATIVRRTAGGEGLVQRALLAKMGAAPAYSDGLTLATIKSTALDKPPRPKMEGADWTGKLNAGARKVFKDTLGITDQALFDANLGDAKLLQTGEIHGNEVYKNKSGDLPGGTTYKEYDIAKYQGDPRLRGGERVVDGADGKNYYTDTHYTDWAEF